MQIKREFAGLTITIDLTDDELFEAYQMQRRLFDIEGVHQELKSQPDSELIQQYGLPLRALEPFEDEMAAKLRSNLNKEMSWGYALSDAIRSTAERHKPFLDQPPGSQKI